MVCSPTIVVPSVADQGRPQRLFLLLRLISFLWSTDVGGFLGPFPQASPAELVLTWLRASHVVASEALLDGSPALRTRLGVDEDPVVALGFVLVLQDPLGRRFAVHGTVSFLLTVPAKAVGAAAVDVVVTATASSPRRKVDEVNGVVAIRSRTPLDLSLPVAVLHVGPEKVPQVLLLVGMINSQGQHHVFADRGAA